MLSGWTILFSVQYALGAVLGTGGETPDFVFILLWTAVLTSVGLSVWAEQLLKRRVILTLPIVASVVDYVMLYVVYPYLGVSKIQLHRCAETLRNMSLQQRERLERLPGSFRIRAKSYQFAGRMSSGSGTVLKSVAANWIPQ